MDLRAEQLHDPGTSTGIRRERLPTLGGEVGGSHAAIGVPGINHHQPDLDCIHRLSPGRCPSHLHPCPGREEDPQIPSATGARVVGILEARLEVWGSTVPAMAGEQGVTPCRAGASASTVKQDLHHHPFSRKATCTW